MRKLTREEMHAQVMKEIKCSVLLAVVVAAWHIFWAFWLGTTPSDDMMLGMPTWHTVSVGGAAVLSIVGVIWLVKCVFIDFEYDEEKEDD